MWGLSPAKLIWFLLFSYTNYFFNVVPSNPIFKVMPLDGVHRPVKKINSTNFETNWDFRKMRVDFCIYSGLKYRFSEKFNQISPVTFALALVLHNDNIQTDRHDHNTCSLHSKGEKLKLKSSAAPWRDVESSLHRRHRSYKVTWVLFKKQ